KPEAEYVGTWKGTIHTYEGERTATLTIEKEGKMTLKIDDEEGEPCEKVRLQEGYLMGVASGDLKTEDDNRQEYLLQLRLKLRDDHLNGQVTSIRLPSIRVGNGLSHWIDLKKVE